MAKLKNTNIYGSFKVQNLNDNDNGNCSYNFQILPLSDGGGLHYIGEMAPEGNLYYKGIMELNPGDFGGIHYHMHKKDNPDINKEGHFTIGGPSINIATYNQRNALSRDVSCSIVNVNDYFDIYLYKNDSTGKRVEIPLITYLLEADKQLNILSKLKVSGTEYIDNSKTTQGWVNITDD